MGLEMFYAGMSIFGWAFVIGVGALIAVAVIKESSQKWKR